jgi:hypothetical protein
MSRVSAGSGITAWLRSEIPTIDASCHRDGDRATRSHDITMESTVVVS